MRRHNLILIEYRLLCGNCFVHPADKVEAIRPNELPLTFVLFGLAVTSTPMSAPTSDPTAYALRWSLWEPHKLAIKRWFWDSLLNETSICLKLFYRTIDTNLNIMGKTREMNQPLRCNLKTEDHVVRLTSLWFKRNELLLSTTRFGFRLPRSMYMVDFV